MPKPQLSEQTLSSVALGYFLQVAELGSFTAAARATGISQPSLSVAIQKLEEELGTQLFVRGRRGVVATATGEALVRHARHVMRTLELAREEIHALETEPRGHFTIGCHESLAAYFFPGFMGSFLRRYPGIQITLANKNSRDVEHAVVERTVDIGLVVNPEGHPECVVTPLFDDSVQLLVAGSLREVEPEELLAQYPLVCVPVLRQVQYILGALQQAGHAKLRFLPCSSMELVKSLVIDGVGVGVLPFRVATYGVAKGKLAALGAPMPRFDDKIALVRRYDMHQTQSARLLLDGLRDHGRAMPTLDSLDAAPKTSKKK